MKCKIRHLKFYGFLCSPKNSRKLGRKNWFWGTFLGNLGLRPMSYAQIFGQIKGIIQIHNGGKFHLYNICRCEVMYV